MLVGRPSRFVVTVEERVVSVVQIDPAVTVTEVVACFVTVAVRVGGVDVVADTLVEVVLKLGPVTVTVDVSVVVTEDVEVEGVAWMKMEQKSDASGAR